MSYLARLKQQISPDARKAEATKVSKGAFGPFVAPNREPLRDISPTVADQWREFASLLNVVAPAFNTPADEYAEIRQAAFRDLPAAILSFRRMANLKYGEIDNGNAIKAKYSKR